jgi:trimeric autotransporter adhesin
MKKILITLFCMGIFILVRAQHWEGVGGGTDQQPHIVKSLLSFNNSLIVGGAFDSLGYTGIYSMGLGYWNNNTWISGNTLFSSGYPSVAITHNDALIIGGDFKRINGNKYCNKVARMDSAGNWMPLGSGVTNGQVQAMASYNGDLYIGGTFTIVDSTLSANRVARWDGSAWHAIGTGIPGGFGVYDMEVFQNELYVGGYFSTINGIATPGVARFNGSTWNSLSTGTNGPVLAIFNDTVLNRLYIGGQFTIAGGVSTPSGVAYWDGMNWYPVGLNTYLPPKALHIYNGILYNATTQYGIVNALGDTIKNLAWFDGFNWLDVGGGLDAEATVMAVFNNQLYIGGYFTHAGDSLVNGIAKWIPGSLGVEENGEDKFPFKIMPNPAKDEVMIELSLNKPMNLILQVTDSNGKNIFNESFSGNGTVIHKINTSDYHSGIYVFSIYENTKLLGIEKVVIQR